MKKSILIFGTIAGLIVAVFMVVATNLVDGNNNTDLGQIIGFSSMLLAFSFVFIGIKNYRDRYNSGVITFGKGFQVGFFIALIASSMYVLTWLIEYYFFIPDFMEKYAEQVLNKAKDSGLSVLELQKKTEEMNRYMEWYKNPIWVVLLTFMEILPIGLLITFISALVLRRKSLNK